MNTREQQRIVEIDIAKGIGIIMVIMGHTIANEIVQIAIPAFHMPLFFILAGLVLKIPKQSSLKEICYSERRLFKTYYLWSIFYLIFHSITIGSIKLIVNECYQTLVFWGIEVLWFIATLIFAKILIRFLNILTKNSFSHATILVILFFVTYILTPYFDTLKSCPLPYGLYFYYLIAALFRIFIATPFVYIGLKSKDLFQHILKLNTLISFCLGIFCILLVVVGTRYNGIVDMHFIDLGNNILLFWIFSLLGSIGVILISHGIRNVPLLNQFLLLCGQKSIWLMSLHLPLLSLIQKL